MSEEIKAGDQVWHHDSQRSRVVSVVDDETAELGFDDGWVPAAATVVQRACTFEEHTAALIKSARDSGRRGVIARRTLARLWSDGKLARTA